MNENDKILIIDGFNVFIRSYLANPTVTVRGTPVGGVVGFLSTLNWLTGHFHPSKIIVVWEQGGGSSRRKSIYSDYKANRSKITSSGQTTTSDNNVQSENKQIPAKNRNEQLLLLSKSLKNMPVYQLYIQDTEADDVIAYITKYKYLGKETKKVIVTNDKDYYQLLTLDQSVVIYDPGKKKIVTKDTVIEEFGISPNNFCLAKTIHGDESDNIPGIKGIGFKTITNTFPFFKEETKDISISDLLIEADKIVSSRDKSIKTREKTASKNIIENINVVRRNWKLMYLDTNSLSSNQIQKINSFLDTPPNGFQCNKYQFMMYLATNQIQLSFDLDSFFLRLKAIYLRMQEEVSKLKEKEQEQQENIIETTNNDDSNDSDDTL